MSPPERTPSGIGLVPLFHEDLNHRIDDEDVDLHPCGILNLRPTQLAVGMQQVQAKVDKIMAEHIEGNSKKWLKFLRKNALPAVKGPSGDLFIIDHHHLSLALHQIGVQEAYVQIIHDWSQAESTQAFWDLMVQADYIWPHDPNGASLDWKQVIDNLPRDVTGLRDDPFRSLAGLVRKSGGYNKVWVPYTEFKWANYLRDRVPEAYSDPGNPKTVAEAVRIAQEPEASHLPGHISGLSAAEK